MNFREYLSKQNTGSINMGTTMSLTEREETELIDFHGGYLLKDRMDKVCRSVGLNGFKAKDRMVMTLMIKEELGETMY